MAHRTTRSPFRQSPRSRHHQQHGDSIKHGECADLGAPKENEPVIPPPRASLLGLPRELRDLILEYVCSDWQSSSKPHHVLSACHQLRHEATRIIRLRGLLRINTEHWPDYDFFSSSILSKIPPDQRAQLSHLALPLPRGLPFDRYSMDHIPINLTALGLNLTTLIVYSHIPRPLPHVSIYGGVLEPMFCLWLKSTLSSMPRLKFITILNYESSTPASYDMPSPRLITMLLSSLSEDETSHCVDSQNERKAIWRTEKGIFESSILQCAPDEKIYRVYSEKLARSVEVTFRSEKHLVEYGLEDMVKLMSNKMFLAEHEPDVDIVKTLRTQENGTEYRVRLRERLFVRRSINLKNHRAVKQHQSRDTPKSIARSCLQTIRGRCA